MWLKNLYGRDVEVDENDMDIEYLLKQGFTITEPPKPAPAPEAIPKDAKRFNIFKAYDDNNSDGYGRATNNLLKSLKKLNFYPVPDEEEAKVKVFFHTPPAIGYHHYELQMKGKDWSKVKKVGITMWETTMLPNSWTDPLNKMDLILTPSKFCRDVFKRSGVKVPIKVFPLPIDTQSYSYFDRSPERLPFVFLQFAQLTYRKGWQFTLEAFQQEFKNEPDVKLILKTRIGLPIPTPPDPRITVIAETWTQERMIQMIHDSDVYCNPTQGEGYGLCGMESMSTGLTTISTNAHALTDHQTEETNYLLNDYQLVPVTYEEMMAWETEFKAAKKQSIGKWYKPSVKELREKMRYAYNHRQETKDKGKRAAQFIRDRFSFEALEPSIKKIFDEVFNA